MLGAGVAGLQAIATANRLGAVVSGFDVRPVVKEQVEWLGATFLDLGVRGEETEGGYARELTPEQQAQQQEALEERIPGFDAVITTALDPRPARAEADPGRGRARHAPRLGDRRPRRRGRRQLRADAARRGDRRVDGVTIVGLLEPAEHDARPTRASSTRATCSRCSAPGARRASSQLDWDDEITAGACVTREEVAA